MNRFFGWIKDSNRWKHILLAVPLGFLFGMMFAFGCGFGMEFKDCHHDARNAGLPIYRWDWSSFDLLDFVATCVGGVVGGLLQVFVVSLFVK